MLQAVALFWTLRHHAHVSSKKLGEYKHDHTFSESAQTYDFFGISQPKETHMRGQNGNDDHGHGGLGRLLTGL